MLVHGQLYLSIFACSPVRLSTSTCCTLQFCTSACLPPLGSGWLATETVASWLASSLSDRSVCCEGRPGWRSTGLHGERIGGCGSCGFPPLCLSVNISLALQLCICAFAWCFPVGYLWPATCDWLAGCLLACLLPHFLTTCVSILDTFSTWCLESHPGRGGGRGGVLGSSFPLYCSAPIRRRRSPPLSSPEALHRVEKGPAETGML